MPSTLTFTMMNKIPFFEKYPVSKIGGATDVAFKPANIGRVGDIGYGEGDVHSVQGDHRVSYFKVATDAGGFGPVFTAINGEQTAIELQQDATGGAVPLFFLPYDLNHNRKMTLTDKQGVGHVNFFLTDMVDGCSVYVEGTPDKPTVYHINANRILPTGMLTFSATASDSKKRAVWDLKWSTMDQRFKTEGIMSKSLGGKGSPPLPNIQPARKVESRDYQLLTKNENNAFEGMLAVLQAANRAPTVIGGQTVDSMEPMFSQGTIFGIRVGGQWSFWVQKRVLVEYFHHDVIASVDRSFGQQVARKVTGNRPFNRVSIGRQWIIRAVDQFWPGTTTGRLVV